MKRREREREREREDAGDGHGDQEEDVKQAARELSFLFTNGTQIEAHAYSLTLPSGKDSRGKRR